MYCWGRICHNEVCEQTKPSPCRVLRVERNPLAWHFATEYLGYALSLSREAQACKHLYKKNTSSNSRFSSSKPLIPHLPPSAWNLQALQHQFQILINNNIQNHNILQFRHNSYDLLLHWRATSPGHQATDSMVTRWGYLCGYLMRGCCTTESNVSLKVEDFSTMWEST